MTDEGVRIAIIDAGIGNLRSVQKAFEHIGARPVTTEAPRVTRKFVHASAVRGVAWDARTQKTDSAIRPRRKDGREGRVFIAGG